MKITDIGLDRYRDPSGVEIQIVELHTDEALSGMGFVNTNAVLGDALAIIFRRMLAPILAGEDPLPTGALWQRLYAEAVPKRGGDGIVRNCIAAVDFALWDLKAKRLGVPVADLFGHRRARIPSYANCAHHLPPGDLAAKAAEYVATGHRALKIRGSSTYVSLREATERVRHVREAIGPEVKLMVDVNGTWDVDTAIQQLKAWERYDVYWLEEPVPPADIAGYARVRARSGSTYIVGGEQHVGLLEFQELLRQQAVDIIQPNAAVTGGITDWLRIHALATAAGVPISPWNLQAVHIHLAAGLPNVKWIEYFMPDNPLQEFQIKLFKGPRMREETTDEGVFLLAPEAPGLGLELDDAVAEACRVKD